jgi:hypothetical protein
MSPASDSRASGSRTARSGTSLYRAAMALYDKYRLSNIGQAKRFKLLWYRQRHSPAAARCRNRPDSCDHPGSCSTRTFAVSLTPENWFFWPPSSDGDERPTAAGPPPGDVSRAGRCTGF